MHTNCLYCGSPFRARRTTKKYCSGNCKQLAYFKRNGMVFALNGEKQPELYVNLINVKPATVKDTVKQDNTERKIPIKEIQTNPVNVKYDLNVKQGSAEQKITVNDRVKYDESILSKEGLEEFRVLGENDLAQLVSFIGESFTVKMQEVIDSVKAEVNIKCASLYVKEKLAQNTQSQLLLLSASPVLDNTQHETMISEKDINAKQDSVKYESEISVKPNVKDDNKSLAQNMLTENDEHFTITENETEKPLPEAIAYIELADEEEENESQEKDEPEDKNELYDMENNVKDDSKKDSVKQADEKQHSVKDEYIKELETKLHTLTTQAEQELTKKDSEKAELNTIQQLTQEKIEEKYEWSHSKFYTEIEDFNERTDELLDESGSNEDVNWVNLRVRCIIENVIRLTDFSHIDRHSVLRLSETLNKIIGSSSFTNLPSLYPYTELIQELAQRLNRLSKNKAENIPLRISLKSKARLVSMQNQIRDFVPLIKFDEINLIEHHRQLLNEKTKRSNGVLSGLTKTKKPADWKERHKHYVSEGLIEPDNDDDENYENDKDETSTFRRGNSYDDRLKHFEKTGKFPARINN